MKRILIFLLIAPLFIAFLLTITFYQEEDERINVVVSIPPLKEVVERIGGEHVKVSVLIPENSNPHIYEPTFEMMKDVSGAEIYVHFGTLEFEKEFLEEIFSLNKNVLILNVSEGIQIDESDPHVWISPLNAKIISENVFRTLASLDPVNEEVYLNNKEAYLKEIEKIHKENEQFFSKTEEDVILVYHPILTYFSRDYGLSQIVIEEEGKPPSIKDIIHLRRIVEEKGIKKMIVPIQHDSEDVRVLAEELNLRIITVNPLSEDYLNALKDISRAVREAVI
jgi:zinc transport system substrate-binding protein